MGAGGWPHPPAPSPPWWRGGGGQWSVPPSLALPRSKLQGRGDAVFRRGARGVIEGEARTRGGARPRVGRCLDGRMHLMGGVVGMSVGGRLGIRSAACRCVAPRCSPRCYGGTWIPAFAGMTRGEAGMTVETMRVRVGQGVGSGRNAGQDFLAQSAQADRHGRGGDRCGTQTVLARHPRRDGEGSVSTRCLQGGTQTVLTRRPRRHGEGYVSTRCPRLGGFATAVS